MAHLLIVELPGGNDVDILQAALARGDRFTFLSARLEHYLRQPQASALLARARELIEVPSFAYQAVEQRVLAAHARHRIDAVLCLIDIRITEAARLAQRLGLAHLNPDSAALLRDKFNVRRRLAEHGLPQPEFELAESTEALRAAVSRLGLPVLIKPADGYGSQNIVALRAEEDLDPLLGPLENLLPCRADYGLGVQANDRMLVERYMAGRVVGCDTLTVAGRHTLVGVHEKRMFEPPSFAIRGSTFIPNHPGFAAIESHVFSVLDAVGFDAGAAHVELMLTPQGPRLIEINPRLVGAKLARLVGFAANRCAYDQLIALHLGEWPSRDDAPASKAPLPNVAVIRWIVAEDTGRLVRVSTPPTDDARIRCVEVLKQPGDIVQPPFENADRVGYVMVCGPSRIEAEGLADDFVSQTRVIVEHEAIGH